MATELLLKIGAQPQVAGAYAKTAPVRNRALMTTATDALKPLQGLLNDVPPDEDELADGSAASARPVPDVRTAVPGGTSSSAAESASQQDCTSPNTHIETETEAVQRKKQDEARLRTKGGWWGLGGALANVSSSGPTPALTAGSVSAEDERRQYGGSTAPAPDPDAEAAVEMGSDAAATTTSVGGSNASEAAAAVMHYGAYGIGAYALQGLTSVVPKQLGSFMPFRHHAKGASQGGESDLSHADLSQEPSAEGDQPTTADNQTSSSTTNKRQERNSSLPHEGIVSTRDGGTADGCKAAAKDADVPAAQVPPLPKGVREHSTGDSSHEAVFNPTSAQSYVGCVPQLQSQSPHITQRLGENARVGATEAVSDVPGVGTNQAGTNPRAVTSWFSGGFSGAASSLGRLAYTTTTAVYSSASGSGQPGVVVPELDEGEYDAAQPPLFQGVVGSDDGGGMLDDIQDVLAATLNDDLIQGFGPSPSKNYGYPHEGEGFEGGSSAHAGSRGIGSCGQHTETNGSYNQHASTGRFSAAKGDSLAIPSATGAISDEDMHAPADCWHFLRAGAEVRQQATSSCGSTLSSGSILGEDSYASHQPAAFDHNPCDKVKSMQVSSLGTTSQPHHDRLKHMEEHPRASTPSDNQGPSPGGVQEGSDFSPNTIYGDPPGEGGRKNTRALGGPGLNAAAHEDATPSNEEAEAGHQSAAAAENLKSNAVFSRRGRPMISETRSPTTSKPGIGESTPYPKVLPMGPVGPIETQGTQETQNPQSTQECRENQNLRQILGTQETQDARGTQGAQESQETLESWEGVTQGEAATASTLASLCAVAVDPQGLTTLAAVSTVSSVDAFDAASAVGAVNAVSASDVVGAISEADETKLTKSQRKKAKKKAKKEGLSGNADATSTAGAPGSPQSSSAPQGGRESHSGFMGQIGPDNTLASAAKPSQVDTGASAAKPSQVATEASAAKPSQVGTGASAAKPSQVGTGASAAKPSQVGTGASGAKSKEAKKKKGKKKNGDGPAVEVTEAAGGQEGALPSPGNTMTSSGCSPLDVGEGARSSPISSPVHVHVPVGARGLSVSDTEAEAPGQGESQEAGCVAPGQPVEASSSPIPTPIRAPVGARGLSVSDTEAQAPGQGKSQAAGRVAPGQLVEASSSLISSPAHVPVGATELSLSSTEAQAPGQGKSQAAGHDAPVDPVEASSSPLSPPAHAPVSARGLTVSGTEAQAPEGGYSQAAGRGAPVCAAVDRVAKAESGQTALSEQAAWSPQGRDQEGDELAVVAPTHGSCPEADVAEETPSVEEEEEADGDMSALAGLESTAPKDQREEHSGELAVGATEGSTADGLEVERARSGFSDEHAREVAKVSKTGQRHAASGPLSSVSVAAVHLVRDRLGEMYAAYTVDVMTKDGHRWQVLRRFSDFSLLRSLLKQEAKAIGSGKSQSEKKAVWPLPGPWNYIPHARSTTGVSRLAPEVIQEGKKMLDLCLRSFATSPQALEGKKMLDLCLRSFATSPHALEGKKMLDLCLRSFATSPHALEGKKMLDLCLRSFATSPHALERKKMLDLCLRAFATSPHALAHSLTFRNFIRPAGTPRVFSLPKEVPQIGGTTVQDPLNSAGSLRDDDISARPPASEGSAGGAELGGPEEEVEGSGASSSRPDQARSEGGASEGRAGKEGGGEGLKKDSGIGIRLRLQLEPLPKRTDTQVACTAATVTTARALLLSCLRTVIKMYDVTAGRLYCRDCHDGQSATIPSRVLHDWDFAPKPVCLSALEYLEAIEGQPLLCVSAVNPNLCWK
eukprot:gene20855-27690_t